MNNFIENISRQDCRLGFHSDPGPNSVLIQISECDFPTPKFKFKEVHQFLFDDVEDQEDEAAISDAQAEAIVSVLQDALQNHKNVIVHCHAGLYRSGAVVEIGILKGFNEPDRFRMCNPLVFNKMAKVLGLGVPAPVKQVQVYHIDTYKP